MSLYSFHVKPVSRLRNESAVRVAAYQSRGCIYDERADALYDYTQKDDLIYSGMRYPDGTPARLRSRSTLWNAVERYEKRYDARTARTLWAALPNELPPKEQIAIVVDFIESSILPLGMIADIAIHSGEKADRTHSNPHVHILLTDRPICRDGFRPKKNRMWNSRDVVNTWRKQWERTINRAYERNGLDVRISCESLEVQGLQRRAAKHLGRSAIEMEQRGKRTQRGDMNREIEAENKLAIEKERTRLLELERTADLELSR